MRDLDAIARTLYGRAGAIADVMRRLADEQEYGVTLLDDGTWYAMHTLTIDPDPDTLSLTLLEFDELLGLALADDKITSGCVTLWFESDPEATGKKISAEIASWARAEKTKPHCRACGCSDDAACVGGCSWAAPGLCSRCGRQAADVTDMSSPVGVVL